MQNEQEKRDTGLELSTRLSYFLVGAGIGAIVALLFAPKSGQELRGDIADATRKGIDRTREAAQQVGAKAGEYAQQISAKAGEYYETTRERAAELYATAASKAGEVADAARDVAARKKDQISAAIEAGKQAYEEEKRRSEVSGMLDAGPVYYEGEKRS
jgi:gas vesicle protein